MHGPHSSHSNMKTSRDWPGIEIGDQIGHPRNLLPSYPDRYRLPFRPLMMCWHRYRINGRRLGTAQPFPLWRLHSGPQSSSVDQYSETPPEHLALTITEVCADRWLPITAVQLKFYHSMTGVIWLDRPTLCCVTRKRAWCRGGDCPAPRRQVKS
jgi:hypothetical protein